MLTSKKDYLATLSGLIPISCVVDVGVRECTQELIDLYPDKHHYLFELNPLFCDEIRQNYRSISFQLFCCGLSNIERSCYMVSTSTLKNGKVSHTQLSDNDAKVDGNHIVSSEICTINRFDALGVTLPSDYLLKIDIDGHDLEALDGFGESIKYASVIVIESTHSRLADSLSRIQGMGFRLVAIADQMYYGNAFWQCDLVFVRNDLISDRLAPNIHQRFDPALWIRASV